MELKAFLQGQKDKCGKRLDEVNQELDDLAKKNDDENLTEDELRDIGDNIAELQAEKDELEAELKEVDAQLEALNDQEEEQEEEPKPEDQKEEEPNPQRSNFLVFNQRNGGQPTMTLEERKQLAEEFAKRNTLKIEKPQLQSRAVTIASGQIAVPTEVHGIENPAEVPYSTILDFVKVEDMTGAGYNKVSLVTEWSEAKATNEGAEIDESNPTFGNVTIQPEKGFKTLSTISNEVLKTSPLNYYGKVEESAQIALRRKVANLIVTKAVGAEDDDGNAINSSKDISALDEKFLRNVAFAFGGDEGIYGPASLILNKKTLTALGDITSDVTLDYVYEIEPNDANPNIGILKKGGLSCRYILSNALPSFDDAEAGETFALYGDLKSVEVDLFGAYDVKVSEDFKFDQDLLAIRGVAQVGVGVTRLYGLVEIKKPTE